MGTREYGRTDPSFGRMVASGPADLSAPVSAIAMTKRGLAGPRRTPTVIWGSAPSGSVNRGLRSFPGMIGDKVFCEPS